jgi:ribosomal protein S17E
LQQSPRIESDITAIINDWKLRFTSKNIKKVEVKPGEVVAGKKYTTEIKIPYSDSKLSPFGLLKSPISKKREEYKKKVEYFKQFSKTHNCVGATLNLLKEGLIECYAKTNTCYIIGRASPKNVMNTMAEAKFNIDILNLKYANLYKTTHNDNQIALIQNSQYNNHTLKNMIAGYKNAKSQKDQLNKLIKMVEFCHENQDRLIKQGESLSINTILDEISKFFSEGKSIDQSESPEDRNT